MTDYVPYLLNLMYKTIGNLLLAIEKHEERINALEADIAILMVEREKRTTDRAGWDEMYRAGNYKQGTDTE